MKKIIAPVLAGLMAISMLSACGNGGGNNAGTASNNGSTATSGKQVEIEFFQNKTEAKEVFKDFTGDAILSSIQPAYIQMMNDLTGSDVVNGIPFSANASGVIYNKAIFAEAGVEVPKTWDEFIAAAETFKSQGINPFYLTYKDAWTVLVPFNALEPSIVGTEIFNNAKRVR